MNYLSQRFSSDSFSYYQSMSFVRSQNPVVSIVEGGVIFPVGFNIEPGVHSPTPANRYCNIPHRSESIIYCGHFTTKHFGNILIDYLSRLWYIHDCLKIGFTSPVDLMDGTEYFVQLLGLLGITRERVIHVKSPTRFNRIYLPSPSFLHAHFILPAYASIYERLYRALECQNKAVLPIDRVYLTRTHLRRHKEIGERRFERFFSLNGFTVVAPEELTLADQAFLFRHARIIASLEGTHAHGIVWRNPCAGGSQIILRKQSECIPRQMMINELWKIDTTWIDTFSEPYRCFPISHDRGPFLLRWTPEMDAFAKNEGMSVPQSCRKGYLTDLILYSGKCLLFALKHMLKRMVLTIKRHVNS